MCNDEYLWHTIQYWIDWFFQIVYDGGSRLPIIQAASANQNVTNNLVELWLPTSWSIATEQKTVDSKEKLDWWGVVAAIKWGKSWCISPVNTVQHGGQVKSLWACSYWETVELYTCISVLVTLATGQLRLHGFGKAEVHKLCGGLFCFVFVSVVFCLFCFWL